VSAVSTATSIIREKVQARRLARRLAVTPAPETPVAVYFADGPSTVYQLRRWFAPLEALNEVHPTVILVSHPATYRLVSSETSVPVAFATGTPQLARELAKRGVKAILYPNHNAYNFRVLRFAVPMHVFIGHGESGKKSSASRQLKAYDRAFVADQTSIEVQSAIRGYDAKASSIIVGSPWLHFLPKPPATWRPDERTVVLYAPTWEGDRPTMAYSSVESHGEALVAAILKDPGLRLIYRPHPWLGRVRPAAAAADARIRKAVAEARRNDIVDTGEYGWSLEVADVCVTDVSSVAHDARAMGKPLIVTVPVSGTIPPVPESAYRDAVALLADDAEQVVAVIATARTRAKAAPAPAGASAFVDAVSQVLRVTSAPTL
jgi:CDP-Glycerol:Poly(glycerophosphate) glycerophosphotransferase